MSLKKDKYAIVVGPKIDGTIRHPQYAGHALKYETEKHFVVKLAMFPFATYFLQKNTDASGTYTLYSRKFTGKDGSPEFNYAVGSGRVIENLKTHLEIHLPTLGTSVFMSLFPEN